MPSSSGPPFPHPFLATSTSRTKFPSLQALPQPFSFFRYHHVRSGDATVPDILYIKLKYWSDFDADFKNKPYNRPGFLDKMFGKGEFRFDPQFSTAKLDYSFAGNRNLYVL